MELTSVNGGATTMTIQHTPTPAGAGAPGRGAACCVPPGPASPFPADLPADTPAKRGADRLLPRRGWPAAGFFAAVAGLLGLAHILPAPAFLVVDAAASSPLGAGAR